MDTTYVHERGMIMQTHERDTAVQAYERERIIHAHEREMKRQADERERRMHSHKPDRKRHAHERERTMYMHDNLISDRVASRTFGDLTLSPRPLLYQGDSRDRHYPRPDEGRESKPSFIAGQHLDNLDRERGHGSAYKEEMEPNHASGTRNKPRLAPNYPHRHPRRSRDTSAAFRRDRKIEKRRTVFPEVERKRGIPKSVNIDPPSKGKGNNTKMHRSTFQRAPVLSRYDSSKPDKLDPPFAGIIISDSKKSDVLRDVWRPQKQENMIMWVATAGDNPTGAALVSVVKKTSIPGLKWNAQVFSIPISDAHSTHEAELWAIIKAFDMALEASSTNRHLRQIVIYTHCQSATILLGTNSAPADRSHMRLLEKITSRSVQLKKDDVMTELRWRAKRDDELPHKFGAAAVALLSEANNRESRTYHGERGGPMVFEGDSPENICQV
jgi:hypothetical protein